MLKKEEIMNLQDIILGIYNFSMASPYPKEWLIKSAEQFNIDDNFEFSKLFLGKANIRYMYI